MGNFVFFKRLWTFKASGAQIAFVGQRTIMPRHVQPHFSIITETLAADVALERRLACMEPHVNFVAVPVGVRLVAILANQGRVQFMPFLVQG